MCGFVTHAFYSHSSYCLLFYFIHRIYILMRVLDSTEEIRCRIEYYIWQRKDWICLSRSGFQAMANAAMELEVGGPSRGFSLVGAVESLSSVPLHQPGVLRYGMRFRQEIKVSSISSQWFSYRQRAELKINSIFVIWSFWTRWPLRSITVTCDLALARRSILLQQNMGFRGRTATSSLFTQQTDTQQARIIWIVIGSFPK